MKAPLRKQLRGKRRALSPADRERHSHSAGRAIAALPAFACGKRVALYLPFDAETGTQHLIAAARRRGVRLFVPVVVDKRHGRIRFYPLEGRLRRGTYGIAVPQRAAAPVPARWMHLIVVPLVGVDDEGRRLGMGGGYYDRALEFRRHRHHWHGPRMVGLAFDCQRTEVRFADEWDVRLDALATESGMRHYARRAS